jgi:cytochrome b subunit of formate dehydrogenase
LRAQHFILMTTFILLAYTGFVHKFPDAVFSWPFRAFGDAGSATRGMIHRVAGWMFIALFLVHAVSLVFTARGREYLKLLWFAWCDAGDAFGTLAYNLGLRKIAPPHRQWNYAEKAEYWALMWGSVVMIITGLMLLFTETVLAMLPKVWHDVAQVIHFYEAVLATLAIVVWHF